MRYNGNSSTNGDQAKAIAKSVLIPTVKDLSDHERSQYSIRRAICALAGGEEDGGLEREVSAAIAKDLNLSPRGMFIPTRLRAGLSTLTDGAGKYTVQTEVRDLIEILRNKARVIQLGATVLSGLSSSLASPVQSAASSGAWVSDNPGSDASASDAAFQQKTMSPKMYTAWTSYSRKLLAQASIDIEMFVRNDLASAHALALDLAAIAGTGNSNQPLGITGTTGVGRVYFGAGGAAGNGGVPTYSGMVDLETAIANANADEAGMKFLTTPQIRGVLRKTAQFANSNGEPTWANFPNRPGVGYVGSGYEGWVSKQVPSNLTQGTSNGTCHAVIFGFWPSLLIGEFGVIDLVIDPYTAKKSGMIEVLSYSMCDVLLRQPASFAMALDATLT